MQDRVKTFDNVRNFRDFGGYAGADGRTMRTRTFYRSAQFGEASEADLAALETYGIAIQADLRRPDERENHGHRWPGSNVKVLSSDLGKATQAPHIRFMTELSVDREQARGWMIDYYREAPFKAQHVETFSDWFQALASLEEGQAAVVNCAAGKDRTGILCALTHHVLGVDRGTIFADYELTNVAADVERRLPELADMFNNHIGKNYPHEVFQPFVGVHTDFLTNALDSIEAKSGSIEAYLAETLGVGEAQAKQLQSKFLV